MSNEFSRKDKAARRLGKTSSCVRCGENRPEALIRNSNPRICARCQREETGQSTIDKHHLAGKRNHSVTVPADVNDHRAYLSDKQYAWPQKTLRNPEGSPLLAAAGCIRGFIDFMEYCVDKFLMWAAETLESLDQYLTDCFGVRWWANKQRENSKEC
jgi:hypothetical protein